MFENGIIQHLVADIPVELNGDRRCNGSQWKKVVQRIPEHLCSFCDDVLDFRDYNEFHKSHSQTIVLTRIPKDVRYTVKCWICNCIDFGKKPSTMYSRCGMLRRILVKAEELSTCHIITDVSTKNILDAIDSIWPTASATKKDAFSTVLSFLDFVEHETDLPLCINWKEIDKHRQFIADILTGYDGGREHFPVIDDNLFQGMMDGFNDIMRNEDAELNDRITAGIMLLDTQLGLRASEIVALEKDCVKVHEDCFGNKKNYIIYNCIKKARYEQKAVKTKTICTPLAKETIEYILRLRSGIAGADTNRFLYMIDTCSSKDLNTRGIVTPVDKFRAHYNYMCARHLSALVGRPCNYLKKSKIKDKEYWIPKLHSFRSTFADRLYRQGFNIDYINCIMSHSPLENDRNNDAYIPSIKKLSESQIERMVGEMLDNDLNTKNI